VDQRRESYRCSWAGEGKFIDALENVLVHGRTIA
jgi:hypothetical protein